MPSKRLFLLFSTALWVSNSLTLAFQITGAPGGITGQNGTLPERQEITEFAVSGESWDLFILALQSFQATDQTDPLSYFQIAGIHGLPEIPWDGVAGLSNPQVPGFCMHGSVLFPIWHRPYLALFEQVLWYHAQAIAQTYPPGQITRYQAAALTLRMPYWDWVANPALPAVVANPTIQINTPDGYGFITNPLYQYNFHPGSEGNGFNYYNNQFTIRHPDDQNNHSNEDAVTQEMLANAANTLSQTYQLLSSTVDYSLFATTNPSEGVAAAYSIEGIHNGVHNRIGGDRGTMWSLAVAAFDPVFWLHHAQVDRLVAMWQVLNPSDYVVPRPNAGGSYYEPAGTVDSLYTPLAPFHSDEGSSMFTAESAQVINVFGYTYPELNGLEGSTEQQQATLRSRINSLYNPNPATGSPRKSQTRSEYSPSLANSSGHVSVHTAHRLGVNNLEVQWSAHVTFNRPAYNSSFALDFFTGNAPADVKQWSTASNLIGTHSEWIASVSPTASHTGSVDKATAQSQGQVSLTHALAVAMLQGSLQGLSPDTVVPYLKENLQWKARGSSGQEICLEDLSGLSVRVLSRKVKPRTCISEFPVYDEYEFHPDVTVDKTGGVGLGGRF